VSMKDVGPRAADLADVVIVDDAGHVDRVAA
jgi:hypothetical protein